MPPNQHDRVGAAALGIDRPILSVAAVLGDEFEIPILAAATGIAREQIQLPLNELERDGFIQRIDDDKYRFVDATARQRIYDGIEAARRARLHRQIGEATEQYYGVNANNHLDDLRYQFGARSRPPIVEANDATGDAIVEKLAHHFSRGLTTDDVAKAVGYSVRAGEKAYRLRAYDQAGSYWRAALKMMPISGVNQELRAKVLILLGDEVVSGGREAVAYLENALVALESLNAKSWIGDTHSRLGYFLSAPHIGGSMDLPRAMRHFQLAESFLKWPEDAESLNHFCHDKSTACIISMKPQLGLEISRRGIEISEQLGNQFWWGILAIDCARHLAFLGRLAEAVALEREAHERSKALEDPFCGSTVAWLGGALYSDLLDVGAAMDRHLAELARSRTSQTLRGRLLLQGEMIGHYANSGDMKAARRVVAEVRGPDASATLPVWDGEWESAASDLAEHLNLSRSNGNLDLISMQTHWLGDLYRIMGKSEESEQLELESLKIDLEAPNLTRVLWIAPTMCLLYFDMGRRDEARRMLFECHKVIAAGEDWRGGEGIVMRAQALVSALERRSVVADAEYERALDIHRRYRRRCDEPETF